MSGKQAIAVLGAGAWGTALALTALRAGHSARLWGRDADAVAAIGERRENPRYLPAIRLDPAPSATTDLGSALDGADCILAAVPAQQLRGFLRAMSPRPLPGIPFVVCAKGIERATGERLSSVVSAHLPQSPVAVLSGPSFAADVAMDLPTAVAVAAADENLAASLAALLSTPRFRCYSSTDLVGVEAGGALKNVLAIAAGAVAGAGLGASAQAAMVTRGFVELRRIGAALGARPETLTGLSGLGDLILTCASAQSRNFAYGRALGRGENVAGRPLAEGVATAGIAAELAARHGIEAPIIAATADILDGRMSVVEAVGALMARPLKAETD